MLVAWAFPPWARMWITSTSALGHLAEKVAVGVVVHTMAMGFTGAESSEVRAMTASYQAGLHADLLRAFDKARQIERKGER